MKNIFLIIMVNVLLGCSSSSFVSGSSSDQGTKKDGSNSSLDGTDSNNGTNDNQSFGDGNQSFGDDDPNLNSDSGSDTTNIEKYCLFHVSGALMGYRQGTDNKYNNVFPSNSSGTDLKHGDITDTVGGVFLRSSDEAYEYEKGGREIDGAVNYSFDSISIPPGLKVEIRSGNGDIIIEREGPYMAYSNSYGDVSSQIKDRLQAREHLMPPWMKKYLNEKSYILDYVGLSPMNSDVKNLANAHYVKVSKIRGVPCDDY